MRKKVCVNECVPKSSRVKPSKTRYRVPRNRIYESEEESEKEKRRVRRRKKGERKEGGREGYTREGERK